MVWPQIFVQEVKALLQVNCLYTYFIAHLSYVLLQIPGKFQILLHLCQLANSKL